MTRWPILACAIAAGCGAGTLGPASVRLGEDACAHCRMTIVSTKTAAQIVSPGAEPIFFDDLGCFEEFRSTTTLAPGAVAFVIDRGSSAWIDAHEAVITRTSEQTPMGSGLVATRRAGTP